MQRAMVILTLAAFLAVAASAQEGRITLEIEAPVGGEKHPVTVGFDGIVYDPALWFETGEVPAEATADERFVIEALATNARGEPADVLALWHPDDRRKIRALAGDADLFAQNRRFFTSLTASALRAKVHYGAFTLFFVQHQGPDLDAVQVYPVIERDGEHFLTNALQSDPVYVYLSTAYAQQLPLLKRPESDES